jgi:hypothetical protein
MIRRRCEAGKVHKITPHDLRRSCAGVVPHARTHFGQVTLDTYADLFDTDLDAVAAALEFEVCPNGAQMA